MTVEVVNDQNRVVVLDDGNIVVTQGGNTVEISDVGAQGPAGVGADGYVLQAYDSTDQVAASTTVAYPVRLGTVDISDGITVANNGSGQPTRITFANDGNYDVQFSIQFVNTSASEANVNVWFRKNETDLADSNSQITVPKKHGAADGAIIMALNLIVAAGSGDYVEIIWQTESTDVSIQHLPAGTTPDTPATPSVIVTATVVRYLEGIASGGTTGQVLTKASATNYDTTWSTPALNLIKTETVGTGVASVVLTSVFSSAYDNYLVVYDGITGSSLSFANIRLQFGATTTGYYSDIYFDSTLGNSTGTTRINNGTHINIGFINSSNAAFATSASLTVMGPNRAALTKVQGTWDMVNNFGWVGGAVNNSTQYTDFTISPANGTITGGIIRVYGYRNL